MSWHLIADIARRLDIAFISPQSDHDISSDTLNNDLFQCLLNLPQVHFEKQILPGSCHSWVSSDGIRLQVRNNELHVSRIPVDMREIICVEDYILAIQAYRTRMQQITTWNTIVPFAVVDYITNCKPSFASFCPLSCTTLNINLSKAEFEKLRAEALIVLRENIFSDKRISFDFFEYCGGYIPSVTYETRFAYLYPYIIGYLNAMPGELVKILDVGCAPKTDCGRPAISNFLEILISLGYRYEYLGIDISFPSDFDILNKTTYDSSGNITRYAQHDIQSHLPYDEVYDVIFCCNVINWYDVTPKRKEFIIDNLICVLQQNGLLIMDESANYFIYQKKGKSLCCLLKKERDLVEDRLTCSEIN